MLLVANWRGTGFVPAQWCTDDWDTGPSCSQRWADVCCFRMLMTSWWSLEITRKQMVSGAADHQTSVQRWINVVPASMALAQHGHNAYNVLVDNVYTMHQCQEIQIMTTESWHLWNSPPPLLLWGWIINLQFWHNHSWCRDSFLVDYYNLFDPFY